MEKLEQELKDYIIQQYGSLNKFTEKIEMPWTTLDSVLKRGIRNSNVSNIIKICQELQISADELINGKLVSLDNYSKNTDYTLLDDGIRRIQRARNNMPVEDQERMMKLLELSFEAYFEDDGSDDPD